MDKIITFIGWAFKNNIDRDRLDCRFYFSVIDSSIIRRPREEAINYNLKVSLTHELLANWRLEIPLASSVSENTFKVTFQLAEEYITEQLKIGGLLEAKLPPLLLNTDNSPDSCPYKISNIAYPNKTKFTVALNDRLNDVDVSDMHLNIRILINRMDDALSRNDFAGVLHASASIFETMAKDVVGIPTVQNQTLKSFFDRYRKDSYLPGEILDYILGVYELRNTTPLAGHGSTQAPRITREVAITLAEMAKAFIRIEYQLRPNKL